MKRIIFILFFILNAQLIVFSQPIKDIILTIGNKNFTRDEFIRIYNKNNSNLQSEADKKAPEEYMQLFINFQLKVLEAEELKMDTTREFIDELAGYRKELAAPYLTDISYTDKMVEDTYKRMSSEVSASHILFKLNNDAPAADTLQVYNKALTVRDEILNGLDFNEAAYKYSDDPTAKQNRGKLGYFSAFQMVYPFEHAAYSTPVGNVSLPFRTSFGYHIIKVEDLRANRGEIKVAHIMKSYTPGAGDSVKNKAKKETDEIYDKLLNGADFSELARQYSNDERTAPSGGELPWFSAGRMIPEFAEPAFSIPANGNFTGPIETPFGYHIIKRIDYRPVDTFEKLKKEIENQLKTDPERSQNNKEAFINKMKKDYGFVSFPEKLKEFIKLDKEIYIVDKDEFTKSFTDTLFRLNGKSFIGKDFISFLKDQNIGDQNADLQSGIQKQFLLWQEKEITDYEESRLEEKYTEFGDIMKEYHDGILLFNISDEKIWSYAGKDTAGLLRYYQNNKNKHMWGERFKGLIVNCADLQTRYDVDKYLEAGMNKDEILSMADSNGSNVTIEEGLWEKKDNPIVDYFVWLGPKPEGFNEEISFIRGDKIKPEPKTLEEARGLYIADYQNYLEEEWIKSLRKKFKVRINNKLLKTISEL